MDIYDYTDYRKYLRDYYQFRKTVDRSFTVRFVAEKIGFQSASFFCQIMNGRSNIATAMVPRFCRLFGLRKDEARYFEALVDYNQAKTHSEKKKKFETLASFKKARVRVIDANLYEFYDKWYYNAIRESLYFFKFKDDYRALAKLLVPSISPAEARKSIEKLEQWGLITRNTDGYFTRSDNQSITTGLEAQSFYINNYQLAVLDLAKDAIDHFPRDARSLSTLTMSVSQEGYQKLENEIHLFRRRILSITEEDSQEDRVYQMNIQLFPLTKIP